MAFFEQHDRLGDPQSAPSAILVGVSTRDISPDEAERGLDELERLLDTAGGTVLARVMQARPTLDPATVIGSGKVEEIAALCEQNGVEFGFDASAQTIARADQGESLGDRSQAPKHVFEIAVSGTPEGSFTVDFTLTID